MTDSQKSLFDYATNSRGDSIPHCPGCEAEFIISYIAHARELEPEYCPFCGGEIE